MLFSTVLHSSVLHAYMSSASRALKESTNGSNDDTLGQTEKLLTPVQCRVTTPEWLYEYATHRLL